MSAKIINGKSISLALREDIKKQATEHFKKTGAKLGLAVVLVGNDSASSIYVNHKIKACKDTDIESFAYFLEETTTEKKLLDLIDELNKNKKINGILVQLPLPKHMNEQIVLAKIDYVKDVDGFHVVNTGNLMLGYKALQACTPSGCIHLIKSTKRDIEGKNAVVVGRSNIVGKPLAMMLLQENATVTICHSKTKNLKDICKNADILCVSIGKANFITSDMIKQGAIVIDVGMNRNENGKLCGDVDFDKAVENAGYITPVPGGVGPMTITMLLSNTVKAGKSQYEN